MADSNTSDPIHVCIARWHDHLRGRLEGGLDAVLHEDCVFWSPVVFSPQRGREVTKLYLTAAAGTLGGVEAATSGGNGFRYVKEIAQGHHAMLEFETTIPGDDGTAKHANGVDIITCDDDAMIIEFKVMMRPLQAINAVHSQMRAMLERLQSS